MQLTTGKILALWLAGSHAVLGSPAPHPLGRRDGLLSHQLAHDSGLHPSRPVPRDRLLHARAPIPPKEIQEAEQAASPPLQRQRSAETAQIHSDLSHLGFAHATGAVQRHELHPHVRAIFDRWRRVHALPAGAHQQRELDALTAHVKRVKPGLEEVHREKAEEEYRKQQEEALAHGLQGLTMAPSREAGRRNWLGQPLAEPPRSPSPPRTVDVRPGLGAKRTRDPLEESTVFDPGMMAQFRANLPKKHAKQEGEGSSAQHRQEQVEGSSALPPGAADVRPGLGAKRTHDPLEESTVFDPGMMAQFKASLPKKRAMQEGEGSSAQHQQQQREGLSAQHHWEEGNESPKESPKKKGEDAPSRRPKQE